MDPRIRIHTTMSWIRNTASRDLWTPGSKNQHQTSKNKRTTPLTKETNERLKIESFKMDEKLRGLEKDIARLRDSWHRHRYPLVFLRAMLQLNITL
jgi:hypothetical protein